MIHIREVNYINTVLRVHTFWGMWVKYCPTVANTGSKELEFDPEGSRRANNPILTQRGSDKK